MPSGLDVFDRIVCINLNERPDRWEQVHAAATPLLGEKTLERFSAIKPDLAQERVHNGRAGCLLSHRLVIEEAYRDGLESVLVFEDDLAFDPQLLERITPTLTSLQQTEWDLFYLGITAKAPLLPAGESLVRTLGGMTTHAMAYHRRAMPELLKQLPDEKNVLRFLSRHKSIDRYYCKHVAPRMRCFASSPLLIFQRDDFSDIQQSQTLSNREQASRAFERHLVHRLTPMTKVSVGLGRVCRLMKSHIDGQRRSLLRPIKAK